MIIKSLLLTFILSALFLIGVYSLDCPRRCDPSKCEPPEDCLAGMVKDHCNCCYICGQIEGQRCYDKHLKDLPTEYTKHPACGEHLNCKLRDDLEPQDEPEAICYCFSSEKVCGSDEKTYSSLCTLNEERYRIRGGLVAISRGPCRSAPKIVSGPQDVRNRTGSFIAFSCEATGWPVPEIEWRFAELSRGKIRTSPKPLPSDDSHIAVQSRGGPNAYEMTSWLQILDIGKADRGIYYCLASNSEGQQVSYARLMLSDIRDIYNDI